MGDRFTKEQTQGGTTAADGFHRAGSAKVYFTTATPTLHPDGATTLSTTGIGKGRLWWRSSARSSAGALSSGNAMFIQTGTAFTSVGVNLSNSQTIYGVKTFKNVVVLSGGVRFSDAPALKWKVMSIGNWDMDATISLSVASGLTASTIRGVSAIIYNDALSNLKATNINGAGLTRVLTTGAILLVRDTDGIFDGTTYNSTSFNRGWVTVCYTA